MSINWVMTHPTQEFANLPGEKPMYKSPPRTSLSLLTPRTYPANNPVSIISDAGILYLTNQRIVYLPSKPTPHFKSFSAPLLNLYDSHITVPWFGPNAWEAIVKPVTGGGLPVVSTGIELKLTFKEGGAPEFHSSFERIKERLQQAIENVNISDAPTQRQSGFLNGVDMGTVHLDQLPTYEASGQDRAVPNEPPSQPARSHVPQPVLPAETSSIPPTGVEPPSDAPPGYEETQQHSIQQEIDRRLASN